MLESSTQTRVEIHTQQGEKMSNCECSYCVLNKPIANGTCDHCHKNYCEDCLYQCSNCEGVFCCDHCHLCYKCDNIVCDKYAERCNICGNTFCKDCLNSCDKCDAYCCDDDAASCEDCEGTLECAHCWKRCEHCGKYIDKTCRHTCDTCGSTLCKDCLGDAGECKTCELERTLDKDYAKPSQLVTVNDAIRFLKHYRLTQGGNARLSDCLADNIDSANL